MGAVVDAHAGHGIVIGTAATAGLLGCLVDDGRHPALGEADGRRQSGKPGADDVNGAGHQMKA